MPIFASKNRVKPRESPDTAANIQNKHLPNTPPDIYRYTEMLGRGI
jgi:hypothetical protein